MIRFLIFILFLISLASHSNHVLSLSPDFVRQNIKEEYNDMFLDVDFSPENTPLGSDEKTILPFFKTSKLNYSISDCAIYDFESENFTLPTSDIYDVSYISDGTFFNGTLWLSSIQEPRNNSINLEFYVKVDSNSTDISLNEYVDERIGDLKSQSEYFEVLNTTTTILGIYPAISFVADIQIGEDVDLQKTKVTYTKINDRVYAFIYKTSEMEFPIYLSDIQKAVKSFSLFHNNTRTENELGLDNFERYDFGSGVSIMYPHYFEVTYRDEVMIAFTYSSELTWITKQYVMVIDVESVHDPGVDYEYRVSWVNESDSWVETLIETAIPNERIIDRTHNISVIQDDQILLIDKMRKNNYVPFSVSLDRLNFPQEYDVYFYTQAEYFMHKGNTNETLYCNIIDTSPYVPIPPPKINITTLPDSVNLRPGEEEVLEVHLNPSTRLPYVLSLFTEADPLVNATFNPSITKVNQTGLSTSNLFIKVNETARPKVYTISINADMSMSGSLRNYFTGKVSENMYLTEIEARDHFLTVNVLEPLTFGEKLRSFYDTYFTPINGIFAALFGIATGLIAFLAKRPRK